MTNEFQIVKTANEAALDANLFSEEKWKSANYARFITSVAVVGSAAVGDFGVKIYAGTTEKGLFYNTQAGASVVPEKEDEKFPKAFVGANQEIQCKVIDAALTNPVIIQIKMDTARSRGFRRNTPVVGQRRQYARPYMPYNSWVAAGRPRG